MESRIEDILSATINDETYNKPPESRIETLLIRLKELIEGLAAAIELASLGIKYHGEVNYYADLPLDAEIGDAYTVKYSGSSGTTPDGTEYVWGNVGDSEQWIDFSKDCYTKAEIDALLAGLQSILSASNKLNPAYIEYDSTHRAVSDTEKSTWNGKQDSLTTAQLTAVDSGIDGEKVTQIETNKNNISLIRQVPMVESADDGKVLTANYDNETGTYSWQPVGGGGTTKYMYNISIVIPSWISNTPSRFRCDIIVISENPDLIDYISGTNTITYQRFKSLLKYSSDTGYAIVTNMYNMTINKNANSNTDFEQISYVRYNHNSGAFYLQTSTSEIQSKTDFSDNVLVNYTKTEI